MSCSFAARRCWRLGGRRHTPAEYARPNLADHTDDALRHEERAQHDGTAIDDELAGAVSQRDAADEDQDDRPDDGSEDGVLTADLKISERVDRQEESEVAGADDIVAIGL